MTAPEKTPVTLTHVDFRREGAGWQVRCCRGWHDVFSWGGYMECGLCDADLTERFRA